MRKTGAALVAGSTVTLQQDLGKRTRNAHPKAGLGMATRGRSLWGRFFGTQDPKSPKAAILLQADALRDRGDAMSATVRYREVLAIDPDDLDVRKQYANMLKDSAQYDEAFAEYNHVLAKRPQDSDVYLQLGHLSKVRGEHAVAIRYYEQAVAAPVPSSDAFDELRKLTGVNPSPQLPSASTLLHLSESQTAEKAPAAGTPAKNSGAAMSVSSRELQEIHEKLAELRRDLNELRGLLAPEWGNLAHFSARRHAVLSEVENRWRTFVPFMLKMTSAVARIGADVEHLTSKMHRPEAKAGEVALKSPAVGHSSPADTVSLKSLQT